VRRPLIANGSPALAPIRYGSSTTRSCRSSGKKKQPNKTKAASRPSHDEAQATAAPRSPSGHPKGLSSAEILIRAYVRFKCKAGVRQGNLPRPLTTTTLPRCSDKPDISLSGEALLSEASGARHHDSPNVHKRRPRRIDGGVADLVGAARWQNPARHQQDRLNHSQRSVFGLMAGRRPPGLPISGATLAPRASCSLDRTEKGRAGVVLSKVDTAVQRLNRSPGGAGVQEAHSYGC
jgi:hypothetical protein